MKPMTPKLPETLIPVDDFLKFSKPYLDAERAIAGIKTAPARALEADFYCLEVRASVFSGLVAQNCAFENTSFCDVLFEDCNFSGCNFSDAYFERCVFLNCKAVGANFKNSLLKNVRMTDSNFSYAVFDSGALRTFQTENTNFTCASFSRAKWQNPKFVNSVFSQNNLFQADLGGVDFSDCTFEAPTVSDPPKELREVTVNAFQASELVGLFGIKVRT